MTISSWLNFGRPAPPEREISLTCHNSPYLRRGENLCLRLTTASLQCLRLLWTFFIFKCSLDNAKRSFYRFFNANFGKVGWIVSNEVIVQLIKAKCFPVLYYGLQACPLRMSQFSNLNFLINNTFYRKFFDTRSQDTVDICLEIFNCVSAEQTVARVKRNVWKELFIRSNMLCQTFAAEAEKELATL